MMYACDLLRLQLCGHLCMHYKAASNTEVNAGSAMHIVDHICESVSDN